ADGAAPQRGFRHRLGIDRHFRYSNCTGSGLVTTSSAGALGGGAFGGGTFGGAAGGTAMSGAPPASVSRPALTSADGRGTAGDARNIAPGADISAGSTRSSDAVAISLLPGVRITADAVNNTLLI